MNGKVKGQLKQFVPASQKQIAELVELKRQKDGVSWKEAAEELLSELGMASFDFLSTALAEDQIEKLRKEP